MKPRHNQPAEVLSSTFNLFLLGKFHSSAATLWRYLVHCCMDGKSSACHPQRKSLHLACRHIQPFCSQGGAFCKIRFHPFLPGSTSFKAFLSKQELQPMKNKMSNKSVGGVATFETLSRESRSSGSIVSFPSWNGSTLPHIDSLQCIYPLLLQDLGRAVLQAPRPKHNTPSHLRSGRHESKTVTRHTISASQLLPIQSADLLSSPTEFHSSVL